MHSINFRPEKSSLITKRKRVAQVNEYSTRDLRPSAVHEGSTISGGKFVYINSCVFLKCIFHTGLVAVLFFNVMLRICSWDYYKVVSVFGILYDSM